MKKLKLFSDRIHEVVLGILLVLMVLVALFGVFSRIIGDVQPSFTTEFLRYALLWTSLIAASYCFGKQAHLAITFVKNKFRGKSLLFIEVLTEIAIIFFASSILIYGGIEGAIMGMNELSPTLKIPVGYIYIILPVSGVFIIFYSIFNLIDHFKKEKVSYKQING